MAGIVLAGGKSTRFGSDKASAILHGRPLLQFVADTVTMQCSPLVVVRARGQELPKLAWLPAPVVVVEDFAEGEGPVAGMIAGLRAVREPLAFVTSCDAPLLRTALMEGLREAVAGFDAAVPEVDGRRQPLVAVYRVGPTLRALETAYAAGERKLGAALASLKAAEVDEETASRFDPKLLSFWNANSPETLAEIEAMLAASSQ